MTLMLTVKALPNLVTQQLSVEVICTISHPLDVFFLDVSIVEINSFSFV